MKRPKSYFAGVFNDPDYMRHLLGRMVSDCEYYLGFGNRHPKHLWAGNEHEQIEYMKFIWNQLTHIYGEVLPWCPLERIEQFEIKMQKEGTK